MKKSKKPVRKTSFDITVINGGFLVAGYSEDAKYRTIATLEKTLETSPEAALAAAFKFLADALGLPE